jgi:exonuclease III
MRREFIVHACNVQGVMGNPNILTHYYNHTTPFNVFVLTETNLSDADLNKVDSEYQPKGFVKSIVVKTTRDHERKNGSGVTFILENDLSKGVDEADFYKELVEGYLSRIVVKLNGNTYLIYGVYCPPAQTEKAQEILDKLIADISATEHTHLIVAGDQNAGMRAIDRMRPAKGNTKKQDEMWQRFAQSYDLVDIIANKNPGKVVFTHTGIDTKSAIDHILVSDLARKDCKKAEVWLGEDWKPADHYGINAKFKLGTAEIPSNEPTVFRVPTTQLANQELEIALMNIIKEHDADPERPIDEGKSWLSLKQKITVCIVSFTSRKDRKEKAQLKRLTARLVAVKDKVHSTPQQGQNQYRIEQRLNKALANLRANQKARQTASRNRVAQLDIEELTYTSYRLAHRKLSGTDRNASALRDPHTRELKTDTMSMLDIAQKFYKTLFTSENQDHTQAERAEPEFMDEVSVLTPEEKANILRPVTETEVAALFKKLKAGKAPGHDGLPNDAYKAYSHLLEETFTRFIQQWQENPVLPEEMLRAIVVPFYKGKGEKEDLKNWRPVSLVCTDYKLFSLFIVARLTPVMKSLVKPGQTSSVPGRSTFDNIHSIRLLHQLTTLEEKIDAAFVLIDSEKAFDRVEWEYLWDVLKRMEIPPQFVRMIQSLYHSATAQVRVNGHLTTAFPLSRGVRQGCPASPLLYVLALEPIREYVENLLEEEKPPWIPPGAPSTYAHADDLVIVTDSKQVPKVLKMLTFYAGETYMKSGFKMNEKKSVALFTKEKSRKEVAESTTIPCIMWEDSEETHLGLPIGGKDTEKRTKEVAFERVNAKLKIVGPTRLPLLEKAKLLNSTVLGALQFYVQTVAFEEEDIDLLQKWLRYGFWGPNSERVQYISERCLTMPVEMGGVGLKDLRLWIAAFRRNQLVRLHRATVRPDDEEGMVYTDTVLPAIFNFVVKVARAKEGMWAEGVGDYFWCEKSQRESIAAYFPPYWQKVLKHYQETGLGDRHDMVDMTTNPKLPLDTLLSTVIRVPGPVEQYTDDEDYQDQYFHEIKDSRIEPTHYTTKLAHIIHLGKKLEWQEPVKVRLDKSSEKEVSDALDLVLGTHHYMMPLKVKTGKTTKGGARILYKGFMALVAKEIPELSTPETEWTEETPALAERLTDRIFEKAREEAVKPLKGRSATNRKSHAFHLWQGRLGPPYWKCAWCNRPGVNTATSELTSREHFRHQAWECQRFQTHWSRLRRKVGLRKIEGLTEIAIGYKANGQEVQAKIRHKALTLHTALWSESKSKDQEDFDNIVLRTYKKIEAAPARKARFRYGMEMPR